MPIQKDLKRLVRARMRKTGESYTAARAHLVARRAEKPAAPDLAKLAGMSDAAVARKTGRDWAQWVAELDRAGARRMPHREIAGLLAERYALPGWWAQMVTVGYERVRGKREPGQRSDGKYSVSKSKTCAVPVETLWRAFLRCERWLGGDRNLLRMSKANKYRSMRMKWADGSRVNAYFWKKGPAKSQLQLQHEGLATREDAARLRVYWSERLAAFGAVLAPSQ